MNIKLSLLLMTILALGLASCRKTVDAPPVDAQTTSLNVTNASADTLNYYLNGTRVNNASYIYPMGSSGYLGVAAGQQNYQLKTPRSPIVLMSLPLTFDAGKTYSLYVAGRTADLTFSTIDTLIADTGNLATIRFVNASPGAGTLDVMVGDTVKFKSRAFKTSTVFLPVIAGDKHIRIYQSGSVSPIIDETRTLVAGRVYTLFAKGSMNGAAGALGTGIVVNK